MPPAAAALHRRRPRPPCIFICRFVSRIHWELLLDSSASEKQWPYRVEEEDRGIAYTPQRRLLDGTTKEIRLCFIICYLRSGVASY